MKLSTIEIVKVENEIKLELPFLSYITAGFPSPADDFLDATIDLNRHLIKHPNSTFYGRARGDSMQDVGIFDGDLLIIDKSISAKNGSIAVCFIDGDFTVKSILIEKDAIWLIAQNQKYKPIKVTKENEFLIWGIVINSIRYFPCSH